MKQHVIKITTTLLIPYDPNKWGETGLAENEANEIHNALKAMDRVTIDKFQAKKCRVDAE